MASLVIKKDVWYAVFSLHHHQKWIRLGRGSKTLAKKALRKLEEEFKEEQFNIFQKQDIPFKEFSEEYLSYPKNKKAPNSYQRDITSFKHLLPEYNKFLEA